MSGRLAIIFAANFPDHLSALIVADSEVDKNNPGEYNVSVGNPQPVFESVEAAMRHFSELPNAPRVAHDRARAEKALRKVDGGYEVLRDPDHRNTQSQVPGASKPKLRDLRILDELKKVRCPTIIIRGLRSSRFSPELLDKLYTDFPKIGWATVDSEHDLASGAPDELIAAVRKFIERL
jgi:pimeloyl-ACP methyl ester carboxylesterase